jgi:hypothetical protein
MKKNMLIRIPMVAALLAAAFLAGCSKKEAVTEAASPIASSAKADDKMLNATFTDINQKVEAKEYESAVSALAAMGSMPLNDQQERAYRKQMRDTLDALNQRAAAGDERAKMQSQMIGRMVTGR